MAGEGAGRAGDDFLVEQGFHTGSARDRLQESSWLSPPVLPQLARCIGMSGEKLGSGADRAGGFFVARGGRGASRVGSAVFSAPRLKPHMARDQSRESEMIATALADGPSPVGHYLFCRREWLKRGRRSAAPSISDPQRGLGTGAQGRLRGVLTRGFERA